MSARRVRRVFATPFVMTIAACGGKSAPPPVVPPTTGAPVDAAAPPDAADPIPPPDAATLSALPPGASPNEPIYRNPPPPQPRASKDLTWRITRTVTGEGARCSAQQVERCQQAKVPCKPPVQPHLCVLEDSSKPPEQHRKYPLFVEQKQGSDQCFVVGTNPPEQTYCPDEWFAAKK